MPVDPPPNNTNPIAFFLVYYNLVLGNGDRHARRKTNIIAAPRPYLKNCGSEVAIILEKTPYKE